MKKLFFLFLSLLFIHCDDNPDIAANQITGKWMLVASLADPGDGSGKFVPAKEAYTIGFGTDGNFNDANGLFCNGENTKYSVDENQRQITINGCAIDPEIFGYELTNGVLILNSRRCIEACALKFRKFEN